MKKKVLLFCLLTTSQTVLKRKRVRKDKKTTSHVTKGGLLLSIKVFHHITTRVRFSLFSSLSFLPKTDVQFPFYLLLSRLLLVWRNGYWTFFFLFLTKNISLAFFLFFLLRFTTAAQPEKMHVNDLFLLYVCRKPYANRRTQELYRKQDKSRKKITWQFLFGGPLESFMFWKSERFSFFLLSFFFFSRLKWHKLEDINLQFYEAWPFLQQPPRTCEEEREKKREKRREWEDPKCNVLLFSCSQWKSEERLVLSIALFYLFLVLLSWIIPNTNKKISIIEYQCVHIKRGGGRGWNWRDLFSNSPDGRGEKKMLLSAEERERKGLPPPRLKEGAKQIHYRTKKGEWKEIFCWEPRWKISWTSKEFWEIAIYSRHMWERERGGGKRERKRKEKATEYRKK